MATLANSNVVVVWSSFNQAGSNSLLDIYGQILSPVGEKVGSEFHINQFNNFNQRTPAIAPLGNGGFVVVWVSEQQRSSAPTNWGANAVYYSSGALPLPSVDINARLYGSNGVAIGNEFRVNTDNNISANPTVAAASDGSFMVAWGEKDPVSPDNSWDIYARSFSNGGGGGTVVRVNNWLYGDQYAPRINALGSDYLVVWTSLGQDGSRQGSVWTISTERWHTGRWRIPGEHYDHQPANEPSCGFRRVPAVYCGLDELYRQPV
ncbi:MAG: hypothetical protein WDM76_11695 [Limisphaerales bacterium]